MSQSEKAAQIRTAIKDVGIKFIEYSSLQDITPVSRGGFGEIFKAFWPQPGITVALKCIDRNNDPYKAFIKEVKSLIIVNYHENIIRFLGVSFDQDRYFVVMQYADDGNLHDFLKENFSILIWSDKIRIAKEIAAGLKCIHSEDIVHRDLHSKNILVHNGKMMITDLGISKSLNEVSITSSNSGYGLIPYIDPEYLNNVCPKRGKEFDIYSLGVLFWEISSGRAPFDDQNLDISIGIKIIQGLRETPIEGSPLKYVKLYKKCWDGIPKNRPTIEEVVERLNNIELIINENKSDFILPLTPPSSPMDPRSITSNTHLMFPLSAIESNKHTPNQPSLVHVFEPPTLQEMNNKNPFH